MIASLTAAVVLSIFPAGLPIAPAEDGCSAGVQRCVWFAQSQGNGEGRSVLLVTRKGKDPRVIPVTHRAARLLQSTYCDRPTVACGYAD